MQVAKGATKTLNCLCIVVCTIAANTTANSLQPARLITCANHDNNVKSLQVSDSLKHCRKPQMISVEPKGQQALFWVVQAV